MNRTLRLLRAATMPTLAAGLFATLTVNAPAPADHRLVSSDTAVGVEPFRVQPGLVLEPRRIPWVRPVTGYRLTGTFGATSSLWSTTHTGLDFSAPEGTAIRAVTAGVVTFAGYDGAYGYKTVVTADDGTEVWYCHQSSLGVAVGERVATGEPLGWVGATGNVTGAHLHLEVRPAGEPVDPYDALAGHGARP